MPLQLATLGSVFSSHEVCLFQFSPHTGCLLVNLLLVPTLLQEISSVAVSVGIAESDILDVVGSQGFCAWREVILRFGHDEWMPANYDIHKHRLATAVGSHNGEVFAVAEFKVHRLCHTPFRHSGHAIFNFYYLLHIFIFIHRLSQICNFYRIITDFLSTHYHRVRS